MGGLHGQDTWEQRGSPRSSSVFARSCSRPVPPATLVSEPSGDLGSGLGAAWLKPGGADMSLFAWVLPETLTPDHNVGLIQATKFCANLLGSHITWNIFL